MIENQTEENVELTEMFT